MTTKRRIHGFQQQHKNELVDLRGLTPETARRVLRTCADNMGFSEALEARFQRFTMPDGVHRAVQTS